MALNKLVFLQYNSYINRVVRKKDTYGQYTASSMTKYVYPENVSFNEGNGVNTYGIEAVNWPDTNTFRPDYLVVFPTTTTSSTAPISRWFIVGWDRTVIGQYKMILRRDVCADNWDQIINAPAFVEKGNVGNNNPLIYNSENMGLNQIKVEESLLKDRTGCGWIIGYLDPSFNKNGDVDPIEFEAEVIEDIQVNSISSWTYYQYRNKTLKTNLLSYDVIVDWYGLSPGGGTNYNSTYNTSTETWTGDFAKQLNQKTTTTVKNNLVNKASDSLISTEKNKYNTTRFNYLNSINGNIIKDNDTNRYYQISFQGNGSNSIDYAGTPDIESYIEGILETLSSIVSADAYVTVRTNFRSEAELLINETASGTYRIEFPTDVNRLHPKDICMDLFCIPYGESVRVKNTSPALDVTITKSMAMTIAQGIAKKLNTNLYDLQLVPFCPLTGITVSGSTINLNTTDSRRFTEITTINEATQVGVLIWCAASSGSINISEFGDYSSGVDVDNPKMESQTDMWRLVSPNGNGTFEFNIAKNGGLYNLNVDYTYLPYQPFIHVTPTFGTLYGSDFNDYRGLICGGDFSIAYLSDPWENYQTQNKNFQNIFDREIQNMDIQNDVARTQQKWGIVSNTVSAATGMALQGSKIGGVGGPIGTAIGAGVGAVAGTALGVAGGIADYNMSEKLRNEALDYKKDMFGYQLDNIKALPQSIAKTTAYNENNKIFPYLEKYTCTDEEKRALANKIAYNGMTIGVIGNIGGFIGDWSYTLNNQTIRSKKYVKAKIINLDNISDTNEIKNAIVSEMNEGVYVEV